MTNSSNNSACPSLPIQPQQPEFAIQDPRAWNVKVTYHNYARCLGVIVDEQVRQEIRVHAADLDDARKQVRRLFSDRFYQQYQAIGGDPSRVQGSVRLIKLKTIKIKDITSA